MQTFSMNGYWWSLHFVDPRSSLLIDRTETLRVATTDPAYRTVYLANNLRGDFLKKVLMHELSHCVIFSYGLLDDVHRAVRPEYWEESEEWLCNFIADYGQEVSYIANNILRMRR